MHRLVLTLVRSQPDVQPSVLDSSRKMSKRPNRKFNSARGAPPYGSRMQPLEWLLIVRSANKHRRCFEPETRAYLTMRFNRRFNSCSSANSMPQSLQQNEPFPLPLMVPALPALTLRSQQRGLAFTKQHWPKRELRQLRGIGPPPSVQESEPASMQLTMPSAAQPRQSSQPPSVVDSCSI